jgi:hypothetical protein
MFSYTSRTAPRLLTFILLAVLLSACQPQTPTADPNAIMTQAVQTALASMQPSKPAATPSKPASPTAALPLTPPALPPTFTTSALSPMVTPHTYISDACQYIKDEWTSTNAAPGTIVFAVMFHSIEKGTSQVSDPKNISDKDFQAMMNSLHDMGFTAINTQQLADFLYHNAKIPSRSVILIQDDRHQAQNFTDHFLPYYQKWGWPVVTGWISAFGGSDPYLQENVALSNQGWVDYQAHGVVHNIPMSDSSTDEYITGELEGSITNIQKYFNKTPIAIIWPGGGFGVRPVQFARKFGYQLGFTINPRGPMMFNWIPLADQADPQNPLYLPEGPVHDPLMTLPRYWPSQVMPALDTIRQIGNAAAAYAQQNKAVELQYYNIMCAAKDGPIQ